MSWALGKRKIQQVVAKGIKAEKNDNTVLAAESS